MVRSPLVGVDVPRMGRAVSSSVFGPLDLIFELIVAGKRGGADPYQKPSAKLAKTPNMQCARLCMGLAWAILNAPQLVAARAKAVIAFFELQQKLGIQCLTDTPRTKRWLDERFSPSHHYQWSKYIWGLLTVLQKIVVRIGNNADPLLLRAYDLLSWWVNGHIAVWRLVDRGQSGVIAMAGARAGADDDRTDDGGQSGVDKTGPRNPVNELRNFEWRSVLKLEGKWPKKVRRTAINFALDAGFTPNRGEPLPIVSEPMDIIHYRDHYLECSATFTYFPWGPPGQGGAQAVVQYPSGDCVVLDEAAAVTLMNELRERVKAGGDPTIDWYRCPSATERVTSDTEPGAETAAEPASEPTP